MNRGEAGEKMITKKKIFSTGYKRDAKMKNKKELSIIILSALVLYPIIVWVGNELSKSEISELSEAVFHVS